MAGMLEFEACVKQWELDQNIKPVTTIARGGSISHRSYRSEAQIRFSHP